MKLDEVTNRYYNIIRDILFQKLDKRKYYIFIFGSRAGSQYNRTSDIDIGIFGREKVSPGILSSVKEVLEESAVPYKTDVVDFFEASDEFKEIALKKVIIWNKPEEDFKLK